jgi:hypothetical protein
MSEGRRIAVTFDPRIDEHSPFWPDEDVTVLAKRHRIEPPLFADIVMEALTAYGWAPWIDENFGGPDTLDRLSKALEKPIELLRNKIHQKRVIQQLWHDGGGGLPDGLVTTISEYDQGLRFLEMVRSAAAKAHRPARRRGPPPEHPALDAAYEHLAMHYVTIFGEARFTNTWEKTETGLRPRSDAACFLFDVMSLIAPDRPKLAQELRALMQKTIKAERGPRPGRSGG